MDSTEPRSVTQDLDPSIMAPTNSDLMLQDISNQLAKSQLQRRLSNNSSNTSGSGFRVSAKVNKMGSAGNSPYYVQRRRTTASYPSQSHTPYRTREQKPRNYHISRGLVSTDRPMSWHPGSDTISQPYFDIPINEPISSTSAADIEYMTNFGAPNAGGEQVLQDTFSIGSGYPLRPHHVQEQSTSQNLDNNTYGLDPRYAYPSYEYFGPDQITERDSSPYGSYLAAGFQMPQWSQDSRCPSSLQPSEEVLNFVPMQPTAVNLQHLDTKEPLSISKKKSNDLIGIGLYDNEDHDFSDSTDKVFTNRASIGRDLKLEETWQPPVEDMSVEDDDDAYSEDETEPADLALPNFAPPLIESQSVGQPAYGDLSDQSFFFEDDEGLNYDENPYANYLNYDQGLQQSELKKPVVAQHGALWY